MPSNVLLIVGDGGLEARGRWAISPCVRKQFAFDFSSARRLGNRQRDPPAWGLLARRAVRFGGAGRPRPRPFAPGGSARCRVSCEFSRRATPPGWLADWKSFAVELPVFSIVGVLRDEGAVAVQGRDDMTVQPQRLDGLVPLGESKKAKTIFSGVAAELAYRYDNPQYAASLTVQRTPPRLTARTFSCFQVKPEGLTAHCEAVYQVEEARTRRLRCCCRSNPPQARAISGVGGLKIKDYFPEPAGKIAAGRSCWRTPAAARSAWPSISNNRCRRRN